MSIELKTNPVTMEMTTPQEYNVILDGVIALPQGIAEKPFFDGLLDVVLAYVEQHQGVAGLSMSHKPYDASDDEHDEVNDGRQAA